MLGKKVTFTPDASDATKADFGIGWQIWYLSGVLTREAASGSFGAETYVLRTFIRSVTFRREKVTFVQRLMQA